MLYTKHQKRNFFALLMAGLVAFLPAAEVFANPLACPAVICLSNIPGAIPITCQPARKAYFTIQIWTPYFNGPATAQARELFLRTCVFVPSMNSVEPSLAAIKARYGMLPYDPGV